MTTSLRASFPLVLFALVGCGSSSISLSDVDEAYADALCHTLASCPQGADFNSTITRLLAQNPGATTCAELVLQSGDVNIAAFEVSVDEGRIKYDGEAAKTCLDALSKECVSFESSRAASVSSACDRVWTGQVALGGNCTLDEDCAGAAQCDKGGGDCTGTCVALVPIGGACGGDGECDQNVENGFAVCEPSMLNSNDHCIAVTVSKGVAGGGSCGIVNQSAETWEYSNCASGLYCRPGGAGGNVGVCAAPITVGQACALGLDICDGNAVCAPNSGAPGASCQALTLQSKAGDVCNDATLSFCNPLDRLVCQGNVCALVGTGDGGQPCRTDYASDCDAGLYCAETGGGTIDGVCAAKLVDGTSCTDDEECASSYCDDCTDPIAPVCSPVMCGG